MFVITENIMRRPVYYRGLARVAPVICASRVVPLIAYNDVLLFSLTAPILVHHYSVLKKLEFCQRFGNFFAVFKLWAVCPEVKQP